MKAINDGTKSDFGDGSPLGMCDCYCLTGSSYDAKLQGFNNFSCWCSCGFWTQGEFANAQNFAP